jgi:response regulator RpfG family c-di-GMP phosphodiesterase
MPAQEEILIVDDTPIIRSLLTDILSAEGFHIRSANSGERALNLIADKPPQLILLDISMPEMDGFEVCRRVKSEEQGKEIPIIFLSGNTGLNEKVTGFSVGGVDFIPKPFQREELLARVRTHLELSQLRIGLEIQVAERTAQLLKSLEKIHKTMGGIIQAISLTVETRDPYTAGHQRRVAELSRTIAQEMGLPAEKIEGLRMAAMIHDLGKINVPLDILSKPTKLNDFEFSLIKLHAEVGYGILKDIDFPWPLARMILEHHERINGSGYPNGLTRENLLIESRIISVADVIEAVASHRPYRPSLGIEKALEEITQNRGILYDPEVVDACLRLFKEKGYKLE